MSAQTPSTLPPGTAPHVLVDARFRTQQRGGDRCRFELARHLQRQAALPYTFLAYEETRQSLALQVSPAAVVATPYLPHQHPQSDIFENFSLPRLARRVKANLYHGTFQVLPLLPGNCPAIVTLHDMALWAMPEAYGKGFGAYMRGVIAKSMRRAVHIITVSDATRRELLRFLPDVKAPISVIWNGVGEEFLHAAELPAQTAKAVCERLNVPTPYVLFVGNLERKKNLVRLAEAFRRMRANSGLPHTLVVVGKKLEEGPESGLTANDRRGPIHFTGYLDDVDLPALYRGADLVAVPSLYRGLECKFWKAWLRAFRF